MRTLLASVIVAAPAAASNVLVLSSGNAPTDNAVLAVLAAQGHTCSLGPQAAAYTGSQSLAGVQTVYLQFNANWSGGPMPTAGQQAIATWVQTGGRLVTCEWATYTASSNLAVLGPLLPLNPSGLFGGASSTSYDIFTPEGSIDAGLPASFTFPLTSYSGSETYTSARIGATVYFTSRGRDGAVGLAGWPRGSGAVFSFSTTCGPAQLADPNFARLFTNVVGGTTQACYANCDESTSAPRLNVLDFSCFLNRFAAGDTWANCDQSSTPPVLNVLDFACYLNAFAAGCP